MTKQEIEHIASILEAGDGKVEWKKPMGTIVQPREPLRQYPVEQLLDMRIKPAPPEEVEAEIIIYLWRNPIGEIFASNFSNGYDGSTLLAAKSVKVEAFVGEGL